MEIRAKQKAKELVNKYYKITDVNWGIHRQKQCALIAVEEILELLKSEGILIGSYYWNDVRTEIEKL